MDYEKKYNDALERARALWREAIEKEYPNDYLKDYETIFPELRESEDERIRKELIGHCKDLVRMNEDDKVLLSIYEPWLAYLEKQKEQKPAWSEDIIRKAIKEVGLTQHQIDWFKTNVFPPKQEWSEEDERILTGIIERGSSQVPFGEPALRGEQMEWLMNRLKSLRPQPREEIYQSAKHDLAIKFMNYLDENRPEGKMSLSNGECEDIDKAFKENDWAKIMRYVEKYSPQPKVVWSEEDEDRIRQIERIAQQAGCTQKLQEEIHDWLKDLRPPFKPSEEQMEALNAMNCCGELSYQGQQQLLIDLYQQLKKLM